MTATMHYHESATDTRQKSGLNAPLAELLENALNGYFASIAGTEPENVYRMVLIEVEEPLLKAVMRFTRGNQSLAARILGINRGTFRKKLAYYGML
jgi:Fis family transcriptional regulator, factor for inversion stimulation protein